MPLQGACFVLFYLPVWAYQTPTFIDSNQQLGNRVTRQVALGDLDQDGDMDAFCANAVELNANSVYVNQGGAQFLPSGQSLGSSESEAVILWDVDGQNGLDAIVANNLGLNQIWLNDGSGSFHAGQAFESANSFGLAIADLNGDNFPDLFFANDGANTIWIGQASGQFIDSGQSLGNQNSRWVTLEDFDLDGDIDAWVANANSGAADQIWVNQGGIQAGTLGQFLAGPSLGSAWTYSVDSGDLDSDGDMDIIATQWTPGGNQIWINQGGLQGGIAGQFVAGPAFGTSPGLGIELVDLDSDLDLDVVVSNNFPEGVQIWVNQGGLNFQLTQSLGSDTTFFRSSLADLDGDSDFDIFGAAFGANRIYLQETPAPFNPQGWQISMIEDRGLAGVRCSLYVEPDGTQHVAYTTEQVTSSSSSILRLYYARFDGVHWKREFVASGDWIQLLPNSLAVVQGAPIIVFGRQNGFDSEIALAQRPMQSWQETTLIQDEGYSRFAFSADGQEKQLALINGDNELLYLKESTSWSPTMIYSDPTELDNVSMASHGNTAHFALISEDDLIHITFQNGTVNSSVVYSASSLNFTSIATDSLGFPHLATSQTFPDKLVYARHDGSQWIVRNAGQRNLTDNAQVILLLDSLDQPHIISVEKTPGSNQLGYTKAVGGGWNYQTLDNSGRIGEYLDAQLDPQENPVVVYSESQQQDLRHVEWAPDWRTVPIPQIQSSGPIDLSLNQNGSHLAYIDQNTGVVGSEVQFPNGQINQHDITALPGRNVAISQKRNLTYISYYDPDSQSLRFSYFDGQAWTNQQIAGPNNGRYQDLWASPNQADAFVAYWNDFQQSIHLARYDHLAQSFSHFQNDMAPPLNGASGNLKLEVINHNTPAIFYHDGIQNQLRLAQYDIGQDQWSDQATPFNSGPFALSSDTTSGELALAHFDNMTNQLIFAWQVAGMWNFESVPFHGASMIEELDLQLAYGSLTDPRIAAFSGGNLIFLAKKAGIWQQQNIFSKTNIAHLASGLDGRFHLAVSEPGQPSQYLYRSATIDVDRTQPNSRASYYNNVSNPWVACFAYIFPNTPFKRGVPSPGEMASLSIFDQMAHHFSATPAGQSYLNLYQNHRLELAQISIANPSILMDGIGLLRNFEPALEAWVSNRGEEEILTSQLLSQAASLWQAIADQASQELQQAIQQELNQSHHFMDYADQSIEDWANAIGVSSQLEEDLYPFWLQGGQSMCGPIQTGFSILRFVCLTNSGGTCENLNLCP